MKHCLDGLIPDLLDPQARSLAETVQWWDLDDQSFGGPVPVAVVGDGPPLLLLHGFDSSFLEFRRLAPLISGQFRLVILTCSASVSPRDPEMVATAPPACSITSRLC